ncbi:MAG: hypothetical protein K1X64_06195 [Myxococcaceae bacterium]|nr:hypothetical protein [Myxococcaceae bacterium]
MAQARVKRGQAGEGFERRFESIEKLDTLLALAGSTYSTFEVSEGFRQAISDGAAPTDIIPELFESEPRFKSADDARALYGNLLGLWDMLAEGKALAKMSQQQRPPKDAPKPRAPKPMLFGATGPTAEYVDTVFRYLEDLRPAQRRRWNDIFENRYDALLGWLDGSGLSDEGFAVARHLLFELFVMLELGFTQGAAVIDASSLTAQTTSEADLPAALTAWVAESVFEAEQHEEAPLPQAEAKKASVCVMQALSALWQASKQADA